MQVRFLLLAPMESLGNNMFPRLSLSKKSFFWGSTPKIAPTPTPPPEGEGLYC